MNKIFREDYGVYCCPHIFNKQRPILLVIRDPDEGDWQFLCGENDDTGDCHLVGIGHLIERDPEVAQMANLKKGSGAERATVSNAWSYFELD